MVVDKNKVTGNVLITVDGGDRRLLINALWTSYLQCARLLKEYSNDTHEGRMKRHGLIEGAYERWGEELVRLERMREQLEETVKEN